MENAHAMDTEEVPPSFRISKVNAWGKRKFIPRYSLENFLPEIGNQGDMGSCTGWATTYYGMTLVKRLEGGIKMPVFSPLSTFNRYSFQNKVEPDNNGAWIVPCLNLITLKGSPTIDEYPYPYGALDDDRSRHEYRLHNYTPLQPQNVDQIKNAILNHNPVVVGMGIVSNGMGLNLIAQYLDSNGVILMDNFIASSVSSGHAMCIVGYDDELGGGAFKLVNSWGKEWGKDGYCWLRYRDLRIIKEAYALIPNRFPKPSLKNRFETQILEINNTSDKRIYFSYGLNTIDGIKTKGWIMIEAGESLDIAIDERINNEIYLLAMNENGELVKNNKKSGELLPVCPDRAFECFNTDGYDGESATYIRYHLSDQKRKASFDLTCFSRVNIDQR